MAITHGLRTRPQKLSSRTTTTLALSAFLSRQARLTCRHVQGSTTRSSACTVFRTRAHWLHFFGPQTLHFDKWADLTDDDHQKEEQDPFEPDLLSDYKLYVEIEKEKCATFPRIVWNVQPTTQDVRGVICKMLNTKTTFAGYAGVSRSCYYRMTTDGGPGHQKPTDQKPTGYHKDTWNNMHVLFHDLGSKIVPKLEVSLIAEFKSHPKLQNTSETMHKVAPDEPIFLYFCYNTWRDYEWFTEQRLAKARKRRRAD